MKAAVLYGVSAGIVIALAYLFITRVPNPPETAGTDAAIEAIEEGGAAFSREIAEAAAVTEERGRVIRYETRKKIEALDADGLAVAVADELRMFRDRGAGDNDNARSAGVGGD